VAEAKNALTARVEEARKKYADLFLELSTPSKFWEMIFFGQKSIPRSGFAVVENSHLLQQDCI